MLEPRGGTSGGGGEHPSVPIVVPILRVGDPPLPELLFFDFDEDESLRRKSLADARLRSAKLTRAAGWPEPWPPCFEPFAHFSMATGPPIK